MTLIIELSAVEEAQLTAAARQMGSTPETLAKQLVTQHLPHDIQAADAREAVRAAAIQQARGSMAHLMSAPKICTGSGKATRIKKKHI